jgi:hypothetical protein
VAGFGADRGIFSGDRQKGPDAAAVAGRPIDEMETDMVRVMLEDADYCDVPADLMTFDDGAVVFWRDGEEVGRHRQVRIRSLELVAARSMGRRIEETRKTYPNAYRSWTQEEEDRLTDLFQRNVGKDVLVKELGRQPGGIQTRLRSLNLLAEDEQLR